MPKHTQKSELNWSDPIYSAVINATDCDDARRVFEREWTRKLRFARSRIERKEDLEDVFAQALAEAFDKFAPGSAPFSHFWFVRLRSRIQNFWRDNKRRPTVSLDALLDEGIDLPSMETFVDADLAALVTKAFADLPFPSDALLLKLHHMDGLRLSEILCLMPGKTLSWLKMRLSRGREAFKQLIIKSLETEGYIAPGTTGHKPLNKRKTAIKKNKSTKGR